MTEGEWDSVKAKVSVSFEVVDVGEEHSQLLRIHQRVTDESGRVWLGSGLMGVYDLISRVEQYAAEDGVLNSAASRGERTGMIVGGMRFYEDGRELLYLPVVHKGTMIIYRAHIKYYSASVDLYRVESKIGDVICLRLTPHVESPGFVEHGVDAPKELPDIMEIAPLTARLHFGLYLLREWSELYQEEESVFARPKFVPTPIVLSATGETAEPTPGLIYER